MVYHAAGWLEGGLIASPEKFIMDCEVLQMIQRYFEEATFATTDDDLAFDAIKEVGRGRALLRRPAHAGPLSARPSMRPSCRDWRNYEAWQIDGSVWTPERAHRIYKQILAEFEAPAMNGDHQEDLRRFVAKRQAGRRRADRFLIGRAGRRLIALVSDAGHCDATVSADLQHSGIERRDGMVKSTVELHRAVRRPGSASTRASSRMERRSKVLYPDFEAKTYFNNKLQRVVSRPTWT